MHLFYNIGKNLLRLWCGTQGQSYELGKASSKQIDEELVQFGSGVAGQLGSRPRPLSRFGDWKSAEFMAFITRYSLSLLDEHLPPQYLSGWSKFVELVELCRRAELTTEEMRRIGELARTFYAHFERDYMKYERESMHLCKYTMHLILHLEDCIRECGPPVLLSQYWMERYIR